MIRPARQEEAGLVYFFGAGFGAFGAGVALAAICEGGYGVAGTRAATLAHGGPAALYHSMSSASVTSTISRVITFWNFTVSRSWVGVRDDDRPVVLVE